MPTRRSIASAAESLLRRSSNCRSSRARLSARWPSTSPDPFTVVCAYFGRLAACSVGNEDAAPLQIAAVEVLDSVVHGIERVGRGVERNQAAGGQVHQLREVVVGPDQVTSDNALRRDDIYGRDLYRAAVPDDEVRAALPRHLPGVVLGTFLPHIVEDDLGSLPVGHLEHRVHVAVFHLHRLVRAPLFSQLERLLVGVGDDDLRRGERLETLDADVAEAPRAHDDSLRHRVQGLHARPDGVVSGEASVGQRRYVFGLKNRIELHDRAHVGLQKVGEAAVAGEAGELAVLTVHVVAGPAGAAEAAGHEGVADHRVPHGYVRDARADLLDPARVLVAQSVGQQRAVRVLYWRPLALDDVYVSAAEPCGADTDDNVERALDLRLVYLLYSQAVRRDALVVPVQPRCFHSFTPSFSP